MAIVIAVGCVFLYMRTLMAPPLEMSAENQYKEYLKDKTDNFRDTTLANPEDEFLRFSDMTDFLVKENLVSSEEGVKQYGDFIIAYVPKFNEWCLTRFNQSVWNPNEMSWIASRVAYLNGIKNNDNEELIKKKSPQDYEKLEEINGVIDKYKEATSLSGTKFSNISNARTAIQRSKTLMGDRYLQNNVSLMNSLKSLPSRLESAHYNHISGLVSSMSRYQSYDRSKFNSLSDNVLKSIQEYQSNARSVYGTARDVSSLKNKASQLQNDADEYFDILEFNRNNSLGY